MLNMEARRRQDFFVAFVVACFLGSTVASVVGPGVITVSRQVLIETTQTVKKYEPHVSTSPYFFSQAVTSKHNDVPEYAPTGHHDRQTDYMSFQSQGGPVKTIIGKVTEGQTTFLETSEKKYWFEKPVKIHMVPNLAAYLSELENYNKRHCPGSCVIEKYYLCSGSIWHDKGGCNKPQACCTGEATDRASMDFHICSGTCYNEELGKCTGVTSAPVKSKSCTKDAPLCCTVRGILIPFIPVPPPAPEVPGVPTPPVDTFRGTRPNKGSNVDRSLQPRVKLITGVFTGLKLKVAQLYNFFGRFISTKAKALKVKPEILGGVLHVLSRGFFGFGIKGRMQITLNVDHFWTNWGQWHQETYARHYGFNHDHPFKDNICRKITLGPWKPCHKDQDTEWEMLMYGQERNNYQALRSIGMGVARVKGEWFKAAGFRSPVEMFLALSGSARAQLTAFTTVLKDPKFAWCLLGLRTEKFGMFANCYNGKTGRHGRRYVGKIKRAIKAYADVTDVDDDSD